MVLLRLAHGGAMFWAASGFSLSLTDPLRVSHCGFDAKRFLFVADQLAGCGEQHFRVRLQPSGLHRGRPGA
jgi:hypothetical protein